MADLAPLLHEISVTYTESSHLRTLIARLGEVLARALPVVEVEGIYLDIGGERAHIKAVAPQIRRSWRGERSSRFLYKQLPEQTMWVDDVEPARVASTPIEAQLALPVGPRGILRISFGVQRGQLFEDRLDTDILVDTLSAQSKRLGQLEQVARLAYEAHRNIIEIEASGVDVEPSTEVDEASSEDVAQPERSTEISVYPHTPPVTDIPVATLDGALRACISRALRATEGRIYGEGGAAELLGLKPSTLQSKMRKLGIERRQFVS